RLREECAINPPLLRAGRLIAIWSAGLEGTNWRLSCNNDSDGMGVAKKFQWHAEDAAVRLGYQGDSEACVWHWLDRLRDNAPDSHIHSIGRGSNNEWEMVEILDICGLSADYCRKCEAEENRVASDGGRPENGRPISTISRRSAMATSAGKGKQSPKYQ